MDGWMDRYDCSGPDRTVVRAPCATARTNARTRALALGAAGCTPHGRMLARARWRRARRGAHLL